MSETAPALPGRPPVWVMGLTNATFGMVGLFSTVTLPQLLARDGVPGGHIAVITAIIVSASVWVFIFSPWLDVRFRRRTYALFFGGLSAVAAAFTVLRHEDPWMAGVVMTGGLAAACLYQGAVGGWMGSLISKEEDSVLGTWFNVANVGGGGVFVVVGGWIILHSSPIDAAAVTGGVLLLPMTLFWFIPAPPPDPLLARESFGRFWREVLCLLRRREVLVSLALFVLPSASFTLTNVLGGIGKDYRADDGTVSMLAGAGSVLAGIAGSFPVPCMARRIALRPLYLGIGIVGAAFTIASLQLPRAPWAFGVVFTGEIVFQAMAITTSNAIAFETIGPENPLAATIFTLLISAGNLPLLYMGILDGWGYDHGGLVGSFLVDAGLSLSACIVLAIALRRWLFAARPVVEAT